MGRAVETMSLTINVKYGPAIKTVMINFEVIVQSDNSP